MDADRKDLGARLRDAREYLRLSQDEVARFVGLARPAISLIETGQRKVEALELKKFADLYQKPLTAFTGEADADIDMSVAANIQYLARKAARLTDTDRAELIRFAEFLGSKSNTTKER